MWLRLKFRNGNQLPSNNHINRIVSLALVVFFGGTGSIRQNYELSVPTPIRQYFQCHAKMEFATYRVEMYTAEVVNCDIVFVVKAPTRSDKFEATSHQGKEYVYSSRGSPHEELRYLPDTSNI